MALWRGRDGWVVDSLSTCVQKRHDAWRWLWTYKGADGSHDAVIQNGDPLPLTMMEGLSLGADTPDSYVYIRGVGYVLVLATASRHYGDYNRRCDPWVVRDSKQEWCGNNPLEPFIVPPGTHLKSVPAPLGPNSENNLRRDCPEEFADLPVDFSRCYIPKVRCSRLFLVQNATFDMDGKIDFTKASIKILGHGSAGGSRYPHGIKLNGKNRLNGFRPLRYKRGTVLLENSADPPSTNADPDPEYTVSPVFAPFTSDDGVHHPHEIFEYQSPFAYDEAPHWREGDLVDTFRADWPDKWPAYVFATPEYNSDLDEVLFWHTARFWDAQPEELTDPDQSLVKKCLEETSIGAEMWGEAVRTDPEDPESETTYTLPFPAGTAFDMVLAVRTWHARRYKGQVRETSWHSSSSATYYNEITQWVPDGSVYLNSQIAGYIYQLAPTRPA